MKLLSNIDALFEEHVRQRALVVILLLVLVLRLPSLFEPYWYGDETIYLTVGQGIAKGLLLYRDIFDHKPPAIYLLGALAGSLFWFKFILLVWHLATVVLFWNLAKTLFAQATFPAKNRDRATLVATTFFATLTTLPLLEGNIANAELFMALPTIAAFLLIFRRSTPSVKTLFCAGLLFSLASLFKIPAIFDALAVVIFWSVIALWEPKEIIATIKKTLTLGIVISIPFVMLGGYYQLQGALPYFLQGVFSQNLSYIASWSTPGILLGSSQGIPGGLVLRLEVFVIVLLLVLFLRRLFDKLTLFVVIWLAFTTFAMLLSGRPYPHYIIQAVAPVSILIGILAFGASRYRFLVVPFLLIFSGSLVFYKFYYYPILPYYQNFLQYLIRGENRDEYFQRFDPQTLSSYNIARALLARTKPQDKVFIWGTAPEIYALSHRLPPGRFIVSFHISGFGGQTETMAAIAKNPPVYIIRLKSTKESLPGLDSFLQQNYIYEDTTDQAQFWRLMSSSLLRNL